MSLGRYVAEAYELYNELLYSLSHEDIDLLRADISDIGRNEWDAWFLGHIDDVRAYVESVPSRRSKLKKWSDPALRRRLVLGSLHYVAGAYLLLKQVDEHFLSPGGSYRDMAGKAGRAYVDLFCTMIKYWPYEDPSPFE